MVKPETSLIGAPNSPQLVAPVLTAYCSTVTSPMMSAPLLMGPIRGAVKADPGFFANKVNAFELVLNVQLVSDKTPVKFSSIAKTAPPGFDKVRLLKSQDTAPPMVCCVVPLNKTVPV